MKTTTAAIKDHLAKDVTALSTCWKITRRDGVVHRFTDCDEDITVEGETYLSIGAYSRTAIESTASLSVDNLQIQGIFNAISLPVRALRAGAFDFAEVRVFMCSWMQNQHPGIVKLRRGYFGEITVLPNGTFKAELRGLMQRFSNDFTRVYSPDCLHDFGDSSCKVPVYGEPLSNGVTAFYNYCYTYFDGNRNTGQIVRLPFEDPRFEELASAGLTNSRYWFDAADTGRRNVTNSSGQEGVPFTVHGSAQGHVLAQDIEIVDGEVLKVEDFEFSDAARISVRCYRRDLSSSRGRVRLQFLDRKRESVNAGADDWNSGWLNLPEWTEMGPEEIPVPTEARYARFLFDAHPDDPEPETVLMDRPFGWVVRTDKQGSDNPYALVEGSVLRCVKTGPVQLPLDQTELLEWGGLVIPGSGTIEFGEATFRKEPAHYHIGQISRVIDPRTLVVRIPNGSASWVDGWFEVGTIKFLTGNNRGAGMEIKGWRQGANIHLGEVELFLSMPYLPEVGDHFVITPGCDRSRYCCSLMWNNIENFFGTPDVPGEDNIFEYPDAKE